MNLHSSAIRCWTGALRDVHESEPKGLIVFGRDPVGSRLAVYPFS